HGLMVSPHVVHEISLHVAAALPNAFLVEYMNWAPDDLFVDLPKCENGWFRVPERPGHGLMLTPDALKKYKARCDSSPCGDELLDQRVDLVGNLSGRKVPRPRELHVSRAGHGVVDLLLVFGRVRRVVHAAHQEQLRLQRGEAITHIEGVDGFQIM